MAIDTAAKRLRALDFNIPIAPGMPLPSGNIGAASRAAYLWLFHAGGIAAGTTFYVGSVAVQALLSGSVDGKSALDAETIATPALSATVAGNKT